ncbi:MAG TPA: FecR domain-containing protein [Sphingomicrobium sp.]
MAAILLIPAGLLVLKGMGAPPFERREALFLATQIGEMKTVRLEDGSMVVLGGQSAIRVVLDGAKRRADVERGRIRFDIEEGSAPFAIAVGAMEISASGAIIDIELRGERVRGQVHQGRALVSGRADGTSGPRQIELDAGAAFEGTISGNVRKVRAPQSDEESAAGMLEFEAAPLAEAVEAANRYSRAQILVADDSVGGLKITGAFRVGDAAGLANSLADMFALKVERTSEGNYSLISPRARKKKGG